MHTVQWLATVCSPYARTQYINNKSTKAHKLTLYSFELHRPEVQLTNGLVHILFSLDLCIVLQPVEGGGEVLLLADVGIEVANLTLVLHLDVRVLLGRQSDGDDSALKGTKETQK